MRSRAARPRSTMRRCRRTIAIFMRSAAVPWIVEFTAWRTASWRWKRLRAGREGGGARRARQAAGRGELGQAAHAAEERRDEPVPLGARDRPVDVRADRRKAPEVR